MIRRIAVAIVACCLLPTWAKERQLVFDQDADVYKLTWDDERISTKELREIAVLSPFVDFAREYSIGVSTVKSPSGQIVPDKVFLASALELCVKRPGNPCSRDPDRPDALFMQNAARNLSDVQTQLEKLRKEKLPRILEPVRAYLLEQFQFSADREKTRYEYLNSGDLEPLRKLLCRECACSEREESLLQRLKAEPDPGKRLHLSRIEWGNRVLECERQRHPATYPMEAWERFVQEFGIVETRTPKHIE